MFKGKSKSIILLSIFLIYLGVLCLNNVIFYRNQKMVADMIYKTGLGMIDEANKGISEYKFSDQNEKEKYVRRIKEFELNLNQIKERYNDSIPMSGVIIGFVGLLTAICYVLSGSYLFLESKKAKKFLKFAFHGIFIHYFLISFDLYSILYPLSNAFNNVVRISEQNYKVFLLDGRCFIPGAICVTISLIRPD